MKTPCFPNAKVKDQGRLFSLCCPGWLSKLYPPGAGRAAPAGHLGSRQWAHAHVCRLANSCPFSSPVLITVHQLLTWQQFSASAPGMEQAGELELLMKKSFSDEAALPAKL